MADKKPLNFFEAPTTDLDPSIYEIVQPKEVQATAPEPAATRPSSAPTEADLIRRAQELDIDPKLALSFFKQESSSNWNSRDSNKGAVGGMQVMPDTFKAMMGSTEGMRDPWKNMEAGLRYIAYGQKTLGTKDPALLAAGYHAGYDRKDLKQGIIPDTTDGAKRTRDYAREVAARVNGISLPVQQASAQQSADAPDLTEGGRFVPLSAEEVTGLGLDTEDAGRFVPLTDADAVAMGLGGLDAFDKAFQAQEKRNSSITENIADVGRNLKSGLNSTAQNLRELTSRIPVVGKPIVEGLDSVDEYFTGRKSDVLLQGDTQRMQRSMTPNMQRALEKKWWDSERGTFGDAWTDWRSYTGGLLQSLPEQAVTMLPAMRLAKAAYGAKVAAGASQQAAAQTAARTAMLVGGATEGAMAGAASARAVRDQINELKPEVLAQSEAYQSLLSSGMAPEQAKDALANDMATRAFVTSGVTTAMFGGMGDRALVKIFTGEVGKSTAKNIAKGVAKGAIGEGVLEEAPQSALQQVSQNEALRQADPSVKLSDDVANQALGGVALGGLQGGGMGGLTSAAAGRRAQAAEAKSAGPLTASVEKAAENNAGEQRVTVTQPDGKEASGTLINMQEDGQGGFTAEIVGDDGEIYTISDKAGVQIKPEAGPLTKAIEQTAEEVAPQSAPEPAPAAAEEIVAPEQAAAEVAPEVIAETSVETAQVEAAKPKKAKAPKVDAPVERPSVEADLSTMDEPKLRERLKFLAGQAKQSGWDKRLVAERKRVEREISKRKTEAPVATPEPAAAPVATEFSDRADANAAMLQVAEQSGKPQEVVERDGKFFIQPIEETSDAGVDTAGDGIRDVILGSAETAAPQRAGDQTGSQVNQESGASGQAVSVAPEPSSGAAVPSADLPANEKPALDPKRAKAIKRIERGTAFFSTPEKTQAFIDDSGIGDAFEVKQTGPKKFEVVAKAADENQPAQEIPNAETAQPAPAASDVSAPAVGGPVAADLDKKPAVKLRRGDWVSFAVDADGNRNGGEISDIRGDKLVLTTFDGVRLTVPKKGAEYLSKVNGVPKFGRSASTGAPAVTTGAQELSEQFKSYEKAIRDGKASSGMLEQIDMDERLRDGEPEQLRALAASQKPSEPKSAAAPTALFAENKLFTADAVEKARARLKSKLTQLNSGIDPEIMMDGLVISGAYIEAGVRRFSDYARAMIDDLGEAVTPYLLSFYEAARNYPGVDTDGMSTPAVAKAQHDALLIEQAEAKKQAAVEKSAASPTMNDEEVQQSDTEPTETDAGTGVEGQAAGPVRGNEGGRDTGDLFAAADGDSQPVDRGSAGNGDRGGDERGQARVRGGSDAAPADVEQPVQGSRGDGASPSDRGNREPASRVTDYRIADGELTRQGSWRTTAERNVEIVELIKRLEAENRTATPEEKAKLVKFTGWGASEIANGIFPDRYGRYKNADWQALGERLKAALTPEEYAQARRTTQYAHYTSESVIRSIYTGLERLGFAGGKVLEPGMGVGHFAGLMPDGIAANSRYTGIEYEPITGAIAKQLYPASTVIVGDYTKTALPKDFFDAAIGNPPFSSTVIENDPEYKARRPMLHDYFFMKTIDRVRPGGLLVFVTSKGTMDKSSDKSRKYLTDRANLLGAIRLPQTAFKDNAGTEVVTDIIFLQKKGEGIADNGVQWLSTKEVDTPQGKTPINEYFADNPDMVLGRHALEGSMYRANEYTVLPPEGDINELFAKAIERLPENVMRAAQGSLAERAIVQDRDFNPKHKKEGGLYLSDDGKLMQVESGTGVEVTHREGSDGKRIALNPKQKAWLKGYVGVRDALKQAQYDQLNDGPWEKSLKALNKAYDTFVKEHGPILDYTVIERTNPETGETTETKRYKNEPLLRLDVEGALAYALENVKEDGTIVKGAALKERVLQRPTEPEIKTTQDALFVSLNRNGALDLDDVAKLAGTDRASVIQDLGTAIYDAPGKGYQLADEYLSGNVVKKLREAQAAAEIDPRYKRNVEALLAVQPRPLGPTEITVRLGANWVPASDIEAFAAEVIGDQMDVTYSPVLGSWNVTTNSRAVSEFGFDKMSAGQILDSVLNSRQIKVTYRDSEGKTHVDLEATEKANDIAGKLRERFRTWIWTDTARADRLVKFYNENFNNIAPRQFDGSHLTLPGVSARFKLYPHQKRAVWRVIQQGDTYLAHAVGAGKTMEMIAAGMEERRLGLVKKPMYVVPNHMLAQFSREFLELYPAANIMVADEHNFHTGNRRRFVAQAALNNPDAIVITHAAFGRIAMSDDFSAKFIQDQIDAWKEALDDVDKSDRITTKQIERRIEQLERRLEGKQSKDKKDRVLDFEELGVDKLYVDEFHEFRKLDFPTNQGNVKGIDPNGSQRALDLYMKVEFLRSKKPGRALVAASGTPITNTMGELFTAQRFFQPEQMKEDGLDTFDAWSAQYGDIVTGFEQNAAGGYEMVARFAKFQNVPELMRRVRSFMDILTSSNLGALVQRPDVKGGGREVIVTPVPDGYKEYQQELQSRIQAIRNRKGPPKKGEDIILNVIGDGRFSAIDMRFVNPDLPSDPNSKLNQTIDDIIAAYRETADYEYADKVTGKPDPIKGSSIILFTDIGLGEQSAASRGFDMRGWIEKRLTDAGIPKDQIAFMRDHKQSAKKERLFADMREGKKRILIGGKEMETGTNVQKRLTHLFHLDAPWFPASVEQREGRIIRQGNQNKAVTIRAYATKGSYDSTMWGMNARKARFIEQAMNGDDTVRSLEDVSEASAFEMASALASGDERYLRLAGLKTDVDRLERLRHAHYSDQNSLRREKHWAEELASRNTTRAAELKKAIEKRQPIVAGNFSGKVGKKTYDSREDFSKAVFDAFKKLGDANSTETATIGEIGGFALQFDGVEMKGSGEYMASLTLDLPGDPDPILVYPIDPQMAVAGIATRAANQVNGLDRDLATAENRITESKRKIEQIKGRLGAAFPEEAILLEKVAELSALQDELAKEGEAASADAAAATVETEAPQDEEGPKFSVAADAPTMLERIAQASELFRLPVSEADTVEAIAREIIPGVQVKTLTNIPGETRYNFTFPNGETARMMVRRANPYGESIYGFDLEDGEMMGQVVGRPGKNGEVVAGKDDVWIDVSLLSEGSGLGSRMYHIAANYAHNTGKIFIGDPAGLSDEALQRRPEMMLSSALKFGTTEHLAPHPRQIKGDKKVGVPGLDWVYGDDAGNIEKLINVNLANIENNGGNGGIVYNKQNNQFEDSDGNPITRADINAMGELAPFRAARAGGGTLARNAVFSSLVRGEGKGSDVLGAFEQLLRNYDPSRLDNPLQHILYSRRPVRPAQETGSVESSFGPVHTQYRDDPQAAIARVLVDRTGEALVTHPVLGDISVVYGDGKSGLSHIAERRGSDFLKRLPDLLQSGAVYSKPGQTGRIFLGNDRDEATLRLDWNQQAKTWLLSAYEKYPDLKAADSAPQSRRAQTARNAQTLTVGELRKAVTRGHIGPVIAKLIDAGQIVLHASTKTLPKEVGKNVRGVQAAATSDGKIHLVASSLTSQNANAVLLHEMFHQGGEKLIGSEQWGKMMGRLGSLYRQSEQSSGKAREFFDRARARVASAKQQGAVPTRFEVEEFAAYAIEEYASAPKAIRQWVDDFIGFIKAWALSRYGKQLGALTPAQLKQLAQMAIMDVAIERRGDLFGPMGTAFSVAGAPTGAAVLPDAERGLTPPEPGMFRNLQAAIQDNLNRVKAVQQRIEKLTGKPIADTSDYYGAEANRPGRIAARMEDAERNLTKPLMTRLAKSGYKPEQLAELLHAQHAEERNARVAEINPGLASGSGMTDEEARKILAKYKNDRELMELAQQARDIAKATLDLKLAYGLITEETHDTLSTVYKFYVPLKGDMEPGAKIKRAMGHGARDEKILENIARDYDQAVTVGEKNLARQSLLRLILENPDPELWTVGVPPKGRRIAGQIYTVTENGKPVAQFDSLAQATAHAEALKGTTDIIGSNGERVTEYTKPLQGNEVLVYLKGDPVRIQINDEKLAAQIRSIDKDRMHPILEFMRGMNRYLAKIYTGYNPAFILRNTARDALTGTINITGREGAVMAAKTWAKYPAAIAALTQWAATGKAPDGETGKMLNEYRLQGGKTGASWMSDLEQQGEKLSTFYDDAYGASGYLQDGKPGKAALIAGRKIIGGMAHVVEIANQATENALRLAHYMALRDAGVKPGKAAQAAKTVTVDFDRKGTATPALGAIYLFFNPAVQGTANALRTLAKGKKKEQAWLALAGLAALGAWAASKGMEDDRDRWLGEGWDMRSKNLLINAGSHQIRVPLSYEFAPAFGFGVAMGEAMNGEKPMKAATRIVSSFIDAYFPLQGAFNPESNNMQLDTALAAVPTIIKPQVQIAVNRSSFGGEIVPESDATANRPDNLKMFRGTKGTAYDATAQAVAKAGVWAGLAGPYENDITKVSPETIKLLWRQYTGGLGVFVADVGKLGVMTGTDAEAVQASDVPIFKDFYRNQDVKPIRGRYYEVTGEAKRAIAEFKEARKAGDGDAMAQILSSPDKAQMIALEKLIISTNRAVSAVRDQEIDINADKTLDAVEKRERLKAIEKQEEVIYRNALDAFR